MPKSKKPSQKAAQVTANVGELISVMVFDPATGAKTEMMLEVAKITVPPPTDGGGETPPPDGGGGETPPPDADVTEKIYKPEEFNGDMTAMNQKMVTDQEAAGDGKMRAVVQFARGKTYEYTDNHFMSGVQRYRCEAVGQGAKPRLRNSNRNASMWADRGPINVGKGANCFLEPNAPMSKTKAMALIRTAQEGDESVTLLNAADASKLKAGRWHGVFSYCQQIGGYPPNVRWIDFVQVTEINGTTVTLDRPLGHNHFDDYWEDPNDEMSVGKARIGLWDAFDGHTRCCLEGVWIGLEFVGEDQAGMDTMIFESHIDVLFQDCILSNPWPTMLKRCEFLNCVLTGAGAQAAEPDKMSEELVFDGVTQQNQHQYVGGATGFEFFTIRNSELNCFQIKPRNLIIEDSVIDSHGDTVCYVPVGYGYNGPVLELSLTNCEIKASTPAQPTWCYSQPPDAGGDISLPLSGSSWQGNKLIINRGFAGFQNWLVWLWEGAMVFTGSRVFNPGSYGRVDKIYAPPDGSALWLDITWLKGTKPTSGNLHLPNKGLRKLVWNNTRITQGNWIEPDYIAMEGTPEGARDFPEGIS